jgi:hypothetical protein
VKRNGINHSQISGFKNCRTNISRT